MLVCVDCRINVDVVMRKCHERIAAGVFRCDRPELTAAFNHVDNRRCSDKNPRYCSSVAKEL